MKRSQFVTRTGVIAATVGSAVGLGNIWRFPYEAGIHGGGAFLLIYIVCVFLIGVPVMTAEFAIGRGTHSNALRAFGKLTPGNPCRVVAYAGIIASMMILSFYSVVAGWIMEYLWQSIVSLFSHNGVYTGHFAGLMASPWRMVLWTLVFLAINFMVLTRGIEKGIERVSNIFMPVLFFILVVFCINSLSLPGAAKGLDFLFLPDFSQITPSVVIGAMGQAFFSLSLGLTCLMTYASYFADETPLVRSASITAVLDTLVALLAGVLIFPAVFSYGMEPTAGPQLVFETLPAVFERMPGGQIWSVAFFVLLFVASLTSTISMSEISITYFVEEHKMGRRQATATNIGIAAVFGTLCALSFGPLSHVTVLGMSLFNLFDYVSSNILLPLGGIIISVYAGWVVDRKFISGQLSTHPLVERWLRVCMRYVAPAAIMVIFIYGLM